MQQLKGEQHKSGTYTPGRRGYNLEIRVCVLKTPTTYLHASHTKNRSLLVLFYHSLKLNLMRIPPTTHLLSAVTLLCFVFWFLFSCCSPSPSTLVTLDLSATVQKRTWRTKVPCRANLSTDPLMKDQSVICAVSSGCSRVPTTPLIGTYLIYNQRQQSWLRDGCVSKQNGRPESHRTKWDLYYAEGTDQFPNYHMMN